MAIVNLHFPLTPRICPVAFFPASAEKRQIVVWVIRVLGNFVVIEVAAPAGGVAVQLDIAIHHLHGIGEDLPGPIVVEIVKNFVDEEIGCGNVEVGAG